MLTRRAEALLYGLKGRAIEIVNVRGLTSDYWLLTLNSSSKWLCIGLAPYAIVVLAELSHALVENFEISRQRSFIAFVNGSLIDIRPVVDLPETLKFVRTSGLCPVHHCVCDGVVTDFSVVDHRAFEVLRIPPSLRLGVNVVGFYRRD